VRVERTVPETAGANLTVTEQLAPPLTILVVLHASLVIENPVPEIVAGNIVAAPVLRFDITSDLELVETVETEPKSQEAGEEARLGEGAVETAPNVFTSEKVPPPEYGTVRVPVTLTTVVGVKVSVRLQNAPTARVAELQVFAVIER
jgi:hypothetical protein